MTDTKPVTREEQAIADELGNETRIKRAARRRLPWFTSSTGTVQKAFELLVAVSLIAVLFWSCTAFYIVMRNVLDEKDSAADLRSENASLRAELDEAQEQALILSADNRQLADELREAEREVCP